MGSINFSPIHYAIIVATLITAVIHMALGDFILFLNGSGYLVLLALYLLPWFSAWQGRVRWLFLLYIGITIVGYFIVHRDGQWQEDGLGLMTKVVEVILVLLILFEWQNPLKEGNRG